MAAALITGAFVVLVRFLGCEELAAAAAGLGRGTVLLVVLLVIGLLLLGSSSESPVRSMTTLALAVLDSVTS